jgi:hypothetical protein
MMPHLDRQAINEFSVDLVAKLAAESPGIIRARHAYECAARKKFWIGGVPTQTDLHAVAVHVAAQLKTTPEAIKAAVADHD